MRYIFILLALLCASCGTALPTIKPYKLDVQQGNVVTSKMLLQLRPGMTKSQVRFIMGTPLIQDSFHGNRWDYVYQMREAGKIKEQRRVILDFENELLKSVRGDVIPAGSGASKDSEPEAPIGTRVVTPIKKPEEKGFMDKLKFWQEDEAELAKQAAEKEAAEKQAAAKAKLEADQAAKKAVVDEAAVNKAPVNISPDNISRVPQVDENAAPAAEESKSLLAVPIEAAPLETPAAATQSVASEAQVSQPAVVTKETLRSAAPVSESVRESAPVQAAPDLPAPVEPAAEIKSAKPVPVQAAPAQAPENAQYYQSESGMQFDRQLQLEVEQEEPAPLPAGPRTGNKVAPKPKELPQESDPSFFDRMLEKIGF